MNGPFAATASRGGRRLHHSTPINPRRFSRLAGRDLLGCARARARRRPLLPSCIGWPTRRRLAMDADSRSRARTGSWPIGQSFHAYGRVTGCATRPFSAAGQHLQTRALHRHPVATPGRLLDLINQGFRIWPSRDLRAGRGRPDAGHGFIPTFAASSAACPHAGNAAVLRDHAGDDRRT